MKAKVIGIFICMLLIASVLVIPINAESESNICKNNELIVFSEPIIQEENQYININLKEATAFLLKPGKPILPVYNKVFVFPIGTEIKNVICTPTLFNQKSLSKKIQPLLEPIKLDNNENELVKNFNENYEIKDNEFYNSMEFYPDTWFDYKVGCGLNGNNRVVFLTIRVYPVLYSPGLDVIKYADSININVNYIEPAEPFTFRDEYDMVVITPIEFSVEIQPLIDYKNHGKVSSKLINLDEIYSGTYFPVQGRDEQEKIKYFIKDAIENWDITYVLLAGGANKIPIRMSYVQDGQEESIISDLYYADIYDQSSAFCSWDSNGNDIFGEYNYQGRTDFVDLYPDVHLGRLNFRSINEVSGVINKIISYESTGAYMDSWFKNIVTCGGDTFDDGSGYCEGEAANQEAINILSDFNAEKIWATNGKLNNAGNIDNAVEDGAGFLYFSGHGTYENWATHPQNDFNTWIPIPIGYIYLHAEQLKNGDMPSIVYIGGCSNLKFSEDVCFGWSFVKNPYGGGIACYGYNALGWGYLGSMYLLGLVGGMEQSFFKAYKINNAGTGGELWSEALNNYLNNYFGGSALDYKTVEELEPFCDPSLHIVKISDRPNTPSNPDGPTDGAINTEYPYSTSATDPDGDLIRYCFDWGDGTTTWTELMESGEEISLGHIWDEPGYYDIKAKVRDEYGLDSEWSETITMHIAGEILEINKISSRIFKVNAIIKNIGDVEVTDIDWSISVKGGFFNMMDVYTEGNIDITLNVDETIQVTSKYIVGIGSVDITVTANTPNSNIAIKTVNAFVLGPFIIII